jgi:hypothetical protein
MAGPARAGVALRRDRLQLHRDTVGAIADSGLRAERVEYGVLPKLGPLIRPLVSGIAILPAF